MHRAFKILTLGLLAAVASGCSCGPPKAGDPCNDPACPDRSTALRCVADHYQEVKCPGPQGCFVTRQDSCTILFVCDLTGTQPGAECTNDMAGFVYCGYDPTQNQALVCNGFTFELTNCTTQCVDSQPDGTGGAC